MPRDLPMTTTPQPTDVRSGPDQSSFIIDGFTQSRSKNRPVFSSSRPRSGAAHPDQSPESAGKQRNATLRGES
ncbi:hypothetical protein LY76DRAFT_590894 [Colletotrichum caudatum]|nr:hypothetical protein LY76DRAFT_590894 [Colletotrichum caudatum]